MTFGSLTASVELDEPRRLYCGPGSKVSGILILIYKPDGKAGVSSSTSAAELFGPLIAKVHFHGRAKTKIVKSSGHTRMVYRGRAPLFSKIQIIHNGPIRITAHECVRIPFVASFPLRADGGGIWEADYRFRKEPGGSLPPSVFVAYRAYAQNYEAFVEYRIGALVEMPQLDVRIDVMKDDAEPKVRYEQASVQRSQVVQFTETVQKSISISNALLLPEDERPSGFKEKTKALFKADYFPQFCFNIKVQAPRHLYVGQELRFEVSLKIDTGKSSATVVPDVKLGKFNAVVTSITQARAEKGSFKSPESYSETEELTLEGTIDPPGPFSKASDWTKTIKTLPLSRVCSTFKTYCICRTYTMRVNCPVICAGEYNSLSADFSVVVHPPIENLSGAMYSEAQSSTLAGSTRQPVDSLVDDPGNVNILPRYDGPPSYDDAAELNRIASSSHEGPMSSTPS